jgi:hypothetical protein
MQIRVGKLIKRDVIKRLLSIIPKDDLVGLKSVICKATLLKPKLMSRRDWNIHGIYAKGGSVYIQLWPAKNNAINRFSPHNSSIIDLFVREVAEILYHEIGHHKHSKTNEYKMAVARIKEICDREREKIKQQGCLNKEIWELNEKKWELEQFIEKYANDYSEEMMQKAKEARILIGYKPSDVPYFSVFKSMFFGRMLNSQIIRWRSINYALADYIRKCKLKAQYNWVELYIELTGKVSKTNWDIDKRQFKQFVLEHVEPLYYITKSGRKYAYFTEGDYLKLRDIWKKA